MLVPFHCFCLTAISLLSASKWKLPSSPFKNFNILKTNATSVGDAMRDLDNRDLITGDFLLVSGDVVSNMSIEPALARHRMRREKDKNAIMTIVLREVDSTHRTKSTGRKPIFVIDPRAERCLHYEEIDFHGDAERYVSLDPDLLNHDAEIEVRDDLIDPYIDICTPDVLSLWSDNFDYQSVRTSFLFGVLKDYELNGKTVHTHVINDQYAARVKSLRAYDAVSKDIMGRWTYPLCPDSNLASDQNYTYGRGGIYQEDGVFLAKTCVIRRGCVLGRNTRIGDGTTVSDSILGRDCQLEKNVTVESSHIWNHAVVGEGSTLKGAIIADGVTIGKNCQIEPGALVSYNVRIPDGSTLPGTSKLIQTERRDSAPISETAAFLSSKESESFPSIVDDDVDSDTSVPSFHPFYLNSQASLTVSSVSTLQSGDSEFEEIQDISRRPSFVSENSEEIATNKDFHAEATASILDGLQKGDDSDDIFLELNAFRMTVNASQHEVRRAVVVAFIKRIAIIENTGSVSREAVSKVFKNHKAVVQRTIHDYKTEEKPDQVDFLLCVQKEVSGKDKGDVLMLFLARELYDLELLEEDGILQWWADKRSQEGHLATVRGLTKQFITFLEEAEEEDESEEVEEEE